MPGELTGESPPPLSLITHVRDKRQDLLFIRPLALLDNVRSPGAALLTGRFAHRTVRLQKRNDTVCYLFRLILRRKMPAVLQNV